MGTKLTLALLACAALAGPQSLFAQSNDAPQGASATTAQKKGGLAGEDRKFFQDIAQANMAEVQTGKLAQRKAQSEEVKKFARHMVQDHGKLLQEGRAMAKTKGVSLPKQPKKEHQSAMKKLQNLSGEAFDRAYMEQMVKDHETTLELLQDASKKAKDPELRQAAEKARPDVEKHLQMAKQIVAKASK